MYRGRGNKSMKLSQAITAVYLPLHAGVEGNELADQAAKEGGLRDQKEADIDMSSAFQQLQQFTLQKWYREFENTAL